MTLALAGLASVLRAAGVAVQEFPGWATRGQTDGPFAPRGVMWHHDASAPGDSPGVPAMMANLDNNGAQCWVDRRGVWHLVAAGRMWHAGSGGGWGRIRSNQGNTDSIGVETDHTTGEDWPGVQVSSLRRGTAAILRWLNASPHDSLCGHKEYRTTNPDPHGLDKAQERTAVASLMANPQEEDDMYTDEDRRKAGLVHDAIYLTANPVGQTLFDATWDVKRLVEQGNAAVLAAVAASTSDSDITLERLQGAIVTAVTQANETTISQVGQIVRSVLGQDNEELADLLLDKIGRALVAAPDAA